MIKLYQYPSVWNLPNASPFCMKMETYLRMAHLQFEIVPTRDPRKMPQGKLPCISDGGGLIADSGFIIDYLRRKYGVTLDDRLTALQKIEALTIRRMLEEHFYWILVYSRWGDNRFWPVTKQTFFGKLTGIRGYLLPKLVRRRVMGYLHAQGIGRYKEEQIYQLGLEDLKAVQKLLGEQAFMFWKDPTSLDACVYSYLANVLVPPIASPLQEYAKTQPSFIAYCDRMREMLA